MISRPSILVTGASRGIGRAIALRMMREYHVIAVARSSAELERLSAEISGAGGSCTVLPLDVSDDDEVADALREVRADVLVNNAGLATLKPFLELTANEWHTMVDVNFNALYHVTRAVLPGMISRGAGHIVNIGSIAGRSAFIGGSCYAATKHAVTAFSESLMLEVRDAGVKVSVIMPGSVATEFFPERTDTSWMLTPGQVAESVAHVVGTPDGVLVHRLEVRPLAPKK
jgi:3-oxoacyl-[acyl-carrier protein] reductase